MTVRQVLDALEWMDATKKAIALKRYSARTERAYLSWLSRFIRFRERRPALDDVESLRTFLTHLASRRQVSAATQKQALSALRFAFAIGLGRPLPWLELPGG